MSNHFDSADCHTQSEPEHNKEHLELKKVHSESVAKPAPAQPEQKPSIGRIVHFILPDGPHKGEHRPAIITKVWSDTCVQLTVFTDWSNDFGPDQHGGGGILWRPSVSIDETSEKPGTFHWPERV